jgi:hypothetical protein
MAGKNVRAAISKAVPANFIDFRANGVFQETRKKDEKDAHGLTSAEHGAHDAVTQHPL